MWCSGTTAGLRSYPSLITMVTIMCHAPTDDRGIPQVVRTAPALPRPLLILMVYYYVHTYVASIMFAFYKIKELQVFVFCICIHFNTLRGCILNEYNLEKREVSRLLLYGQMGR